jgi:hypothetical protein
MTESSIVNFQIDNTAPTLAVYELQTGAYVEKNITFNVSATDVFLHDVTYSIDGGSWVDIDTAWNTEQVLDGSHIVRIRARDKSGRSTIQTMTLIVDNTPPVCAVNSPVEDEYLDGTYTFKLSASDSVGIDRVYVHVFGANFTATFSGATGYYEYTTDTSIRADGTYACQAIAYDKSGKMTISSGVSFNIDNNAPQMTINDLQTGDYVEGIVVFNVSASDTFLLDVSYSVDGGGWIPITTPWNTTRLLDGSHSLTIRARDEAGHEVKQDLDLIVDNHKPITVVNSPVPDEFIQGAYRFRLTATDQVGIDSVKLNIFGSNFTAVLSLTSGYYELILDTTLRHDGNYSCHAIAIDKSGKMNVSEIIHFQVDNNAPVLKVLHPLEGSYLEGNETMVVNATDVFMDRVEYNVDSSGWVDISEPLNTTIFSDGYHTIEFRAVDLAGHITQISYEVIIDNTLPYGAVSNPSQNQYLEGTPTFQVVASDIVGIREVKIEIFNDTLDMNYNTQTGYYEYRTDTRLIPDGTYTLNVTVTDLSGKSIRLGPIVFNLDNHVPELTVNDLTNGDILEAIYNFDVDAYDMFLDKVQYQVDETQWVNISTPLNTTQFEDGNHKVRVRAIDLSEKMTMVSFDIIIDNNAPICTITSPVEDEFVEGVITIKVTAFDQVAVDYVIIKVYDIEVRVPYNAQTGYYEYTTNTVTWGSGEDGIRNVTAIAYDLTGKTATYGPIFFNVDNRAPTINIKSPKEGEIVSGMFFFDVDNGDVFKKSTDYNIDGASWQPVSIGWNTELVDDGPHRVTIRATDLAGHVTMEVINVIVDNHDPEVLIAAPSEGEYIENTYTFKVTASDEVGIHHVLMKVSDIERIMSFNTLSGYYEYTLDTKVLLDGTYSINATAVDIAGRTVVTEDVSFKVDNYDPVLRVDAPVKGQIISGLFVVRAQTEDKFPGLVRYAIDGTTWFDVTTPWNTTRVLDGRHTVTVSTVDQAGHRTDFDIEVIVDNTAPVISQATVTPGQILTGIQNLRFYVYDSIGIHQVHLSVNDAAPFEIFRGEAGLYYEYMFNTRIVPDGDNTINLTAQDMAGNVFETTYGIKVDNTGPDVSLDYYWIEGGEAVNIGDVKEGKSVVFEATVIDPSGVGSVMINIDSSGWREMTPDSNTSNPNTFVLFWPTSGVEGGSHVFQIRTTDKVGNENVISGLINVKEHREKEKFIDSFKNYLPVIWLILFIILVILLFVLAYTGVLTKWAKGEGMKKEPKEEGEDEEEPPEGEEGEKKESGIRRVKNIFKKEKPSTDAKEEDWDKEGGK